MRRQRSSAVIDVVHRPSRILGRAAITALGSVILGVIAAHRPVLFAQQGTIVPMNNVLPLLEQDKAVFGPW
jgi:hypothetical protein